MGNCQAIDTATLVIQYPSGKVDKLYWPVTASKVIKMNPGHYVALLMSTTLCSKPEDYETNSNDKNDINSVRLTRIKLLGPNDTLVLGQVYRLITTQEVMKRLREKKQAKLKRIRTQAENKPHELEREKLVSRSLMEENRGSDNQATKYERHQTRTTHSAIARSRTWQPLLQSISESAN